MPAFETEGPIPPFIEKLKRRKRKRKMKELVAQECEVNTVFNRWLTIMSGHILSASIFDTPAAMIDTLSHSSFAFASVTFPSWKSFSTPAIRMHGVKVVGDIKRRSSIDMSKCNVAL